MTGRASAMAVAGLYRRPAYNASPMSSVAPRGAGIPAIAGSIAIVGGLLVLIGWAFGIESLPQPMANASSMKPSTASAFVAIGAALWLYSKTRFSLAAASLGGVVALVGLISLGHLVFGQD